MKMAVRMFIATVAEGSEEERRKGRMVRSRGVPHVCMNGDTLGLARRSEIVVDHRTRGQGEMSSQVRPRDLGHAGRFSEDVFGCYLRVKVSY
jgi:hypothetical protein